jgi:uncharacterized membrane protein YccC
MGTLARRAHDLAHDVAALDRTRLQWIGPLRAAAIVTAAFAVGQITDSPVAALLFCVGALFGGAADLGEAYRWRWRTIAWATFWAGLATALGAAVAGIAPLHIAVGVAVAAASGYVGALGPRGALVGVLALVCFAVFSGSPVPLPRALESGALYWLGGLVVCVAASALWPAHRWGASRSALAAAWRACAAYAAADAAGRVQRSAEIRGAFDTAVKVLASSGASDATTAWMHTLVRSGLDSAAALHAVDHAALPPALDRTAQQVMRAIARGIVRRRSRNSATEALHNLRAEIDALPASAPEAEAMYAPLARAVHALHEEWPIGPRFRHGELFPRGDGIGGRLRAHLRWKDPFLRHAVRLSIVFGIAVAMTYLLRLPHVYWIPMTVAWVSRPDMSGTVSRIASRIAGTVVGVLICYLLLEVVGIRSPWLLGGLVLAATWISLTFLWSNYAVAVAGITTLVLTLFVSAGDDPGEDVTLRAALTILAGVMVLAAALIWPTRSGTNAVGTVRSYAEAVDGYLRAIGEPVTDTAATVDEDAVREARGNAVRRQGSARATLAAAAREIGRRVADLDLLEQICAELDQCLSDGIAAQLSARGDARPDVAAPTARVRDILASLGHT